MPRLQISISLVLVKRFLLRLGMGSRTVMCPRTRSRQSAQPISSTLPGPNLAGLTSGDQQVSASKHLQHRKMHGPAPLARTNAPEQKAKRSQQLPAACSRQQVRSHDTSRCIRQQIHSCTDTWAYKTSCHPTVACNALRRWRLSLECQSALPMCKSRCIHAARQTCVCTCEDARSCSLPVDF